MKSSDLTVSIIIVCVFIALYLFNFLVISIQHIKDNWPEYRCNPMIMPFTSIFGFSSSENFTYCIQNMQKNYMGYLLQPLNYNLDVFGAIGTTLGVNIGSLRTFISTIRDSIMSIVTAIFSLFSNFLTEIQRLVTNIKAMLGKLAGVMAGLLNTMSGSMMTMQSLWSGPPGQMVRALCFHPDTVLQLADGTLTKMDAVPLNAVLKTGARVCAVMHITNLDASGQQIERLYAVPGGEAGATIQVSGSHLVYDPVANAFVHVEDLPAATRTNQACDTFTCLITSNHTIPIGKWIFHDWEDSNGSAPKQLG